MSENSIETTPSPVSEPPQPNLPPSPPPNTSASHSNGISKLIGGIILGVLGTFLVGAGVCFGVFNSHSTSDYDASRDRQKQLPALQTLQQKATAPNADAKSLWYYAHALKSEALQTLLKNPQSPEQNQQLANQYLTKSANLGQPEAMLELGDSLLAKSLTKDQNGDIDYATAPIADVAQLDTAVNWYIKAYQKTCDFQQFSDDDVDGLLSELTNENQQLTTSGGTSRFFQELQKNPALVNHPTLYSHLSSLVLKDKVFCYQDRQFITRDLIDHLISQEPITSAERQLDYVTAEFINEPDIVYLQHKKISASEVKAFNSQTKAIYDDYIKLFGKPELRGETSETTSEIASQ